MNRLIILAVFTAILLLGAPFYSAVNVSAASNPAPDKVKAWFYPAADPVPLLPSDPDSQINLWIMETKPTGGTVDTDVIDFIQIRQPSDLPYQLSGAEVYGFDNDTNTWSRVSGGGTGDWKITPVTFGSAVYGFDVELNPGGAPLDNDTVPGVSNNFDALVISIQVAGYNDPGAALAGTVETWTVTASWDTGDTVIMYVDHIVDNSAPMVQPTVATQNLLSAVCIATPTFRFNVSITDNVPGLEGINEAFYGGEAQNGTEILWNLPTPLTLSSFLDKNRWTSESGAIVNWSINASLKNGFDATTWPGGPFDFEPNSPLALGNDKYGANGFVVSGDPYSPINESTDGELGYIWAMLVIYIRAYTTTWGTVDYLYLDRMLYQGSGIFESNVNLANAFRIAGAGPASFGATFGQLIYADLTFIVGVYDATLDYHRDWALSDFINAPGDGNDYNDTVSAPISAGSRDWYNFELYVWNQTLDIEKNPIQVTLNSNPIPSTGLHVGEPPYSFPAWAPSPVHGFYRTPFFNLTWTWDPAWGPDPTFEMWNVTIQRWDGTNWVTVITEEGTFGPPTGPFTFLFDVLDIGTGRYSIHILMKDCGGWDYAYDSGLSAFLLSPAHQRWQFNVTYFLAVFINNNPYSLWRLGPGAWEEFYQDESFQVSIMTFGTRLDGSPLDWSQYDVNATISLQVGAPPAIGTVPVFSINMDNPVATTPTYAWWNFTVSGTDDLGQVIGVYNVTASWMNVSTTPAFQVDNNFNIPVPPPFEESTFIIKARIFLHFYVYDEMYSTGETATFFGHVADINWPAPGSGVPGALVAYDVERDVNGQPMATGFGVTNSDGFVVPSLYGEIVFGTEIGDDWAPGLYNVFATAYYNHSPGFWYDPSVPGWVTVYVISTDNASDQFEVWVFRDENITEGFDDLFAALSGISDDMATLAASVNDVLDVLNNDVLPALNDIMDQLGGLSDTITNLNNAVADLQDAVASLQDTVSALSDIQNTLDDLVGQVGDIANAVGDIQDSLMGIQGMLDEISDAVGGVSDQLTALAGDVAALADAVANVQGALDDLSGAVDGIAGDIDDLSGAVDSLAGDVADVSSKVDDVNNKLGDVEANLSDKVDQAFGDLNSMAMITMVLIIIALAVSALTAFKVFKS